MGSSKEPGSRHEQEQRTRHELHRLLENGTPQFIHVIKNWLADAGNKPSPPSQPPSSHKRPK